MATTTPFGGVTPFLQNNSNALLNAGIGLLSGRTANEQAAMGLQGFAQGRQQNKTAEWLMNNAPPDIAQAVQAGVISPAEAFQAVTASKTKRAPIQMNGRLLDPDTYQVLADFSTPAADQETFFGNPIPVQNADGTVSYGQIGNRGTFRPIQIGEGQTFAPPVKTVDTGTGTALIGPGGTQVGTINKDLAGAEAQKTLGKGQGDAAVSYESMKSKMPGLLEVVDDLNVLADKATYTTAGQVIDYGMKELGMSPREAAIARTEYIAKVDNQVLPLLRDTFGAAFTLKEGETLRATLGDPDKSPAEKKAVLNAFIEQKVRDVEALAKQSGSAIPTGDRNLKGNRTSSGVQWSVE